MEARKVFPPRTLPNRSARCSNPCPSGEGEVFIYRYIRKNSSGVRIVEPVITRMTVLRYNKRQEASDRVVVLFDKNRIVIAMGHSDGTDQLDAY